MSPLCAFCSPAPPRSDRHRRRHAAVTRYRAPQRHVSACSVREAYKGAPAALAGGERDAWYMRRCVELALQAEGQTRPNPVVGCVLVGADGRVIAEGHHARAGQMHAEATALAEARARGEATRGATCYVNLEPCSHYGRTPPCADALIEAQVARVVAGISDPFPAVAGRGFKRMRAAGLAVDVGVEGALCADVNAGFVRRVTKGLPHGTLKYAMSLDGKIATDARSSRWVTGAAARRHVHGMRAAADALVVGGATLRADNPRLSVRDGAGHGSADHLAPWRVVLTRTLDLPLDAAFWAPEGADEYAGAPLVIADAKHGRPHVAAELRARGVVVEEVAGLRPKDAAKLLAEKECMNVMWECGGALARDVVADGCVQKVAAFIAPKLVGGQGAPTPIDGTSLHASMLDSIQLSRSSVQTFANGDLLVTAYIDDDQDS